MELIDRTPKRFPCSIGACPAVLEAGDKLVVIGRRVTEDSHPELRGRIGEGEMAIEIDTALVVEAVGQICLPDA